MEPNTAGNDMENEIKELIDKYEDKSLEEPAFYFQWQEFIEDLKSLFEIKEIVTSENGIKKVYERFKHLDMLLSDVVTLNTDNDPIHATCYELWKVIKNENAKDKTE